MGFLKDFCRDRGPMGASVPTKCVFYIRDDAPRTENVPFRGNFFRLSASKCWVGYLGNVTPNVTYRTLFYSYVTSARKLLTLKIDFGIILDVREG